VCAVVFFSGESGEFKANGGNCVEFVLVVHQEQDIAGEDAPDGAHDVSGWQGGRKEQQT
jgi:hypothetical protein